MGADDSSPVSIREAKIEDARQVAMAHVASWKTSYIGQVPQKVLDELSVSKREAAWLEVISDTGQKVLVAEKNKKIIGFSSFGPARDEDLDPGIGELYALYLTEENKRSGTGRALWNYSFTALNESGFDSIILWVLDTNEIARKFYEKVGFVYDNKNRPMNIGGKDVIALRYRFKS